MLSNVLSSPVWLTILILAGLLLLAGLWWMFGPGARRARALRNARNLLKQGNWAESLKIIERMGRKLPRRWRKRFQFVEEDSLQAARTQALKERDYDKALEFAYQIAHLREQPETTAQLDIQSAMLDDVRRLFSEGSTRKIHELITRPLLAASAEASFWQALCCLRDGETDHALVWLQACAEGRGPRSSGAATGTLTTAFLDPLLYLGALLLRRGQVKEALRILTEANRLDSSCPMVTVQLGAAMIAAGGDPAFAVRALKKAMGPKGLGQWLGKPAQAWVEAFPDHRSYVRKLASKHPYNCPIWGSDLQLMQRQGKFALAQGLYRQGQFQEAADVFGEVLAEGAPSAALLRGLGMSLAKVGRFDDAFKHLRIAHEMEEPKDRLTAGYLAQCGARGKPSRPEDAVQNAAWAVQLVTRFNAPNDPEWAGIISDVFAQARECQVPLSLDDQLYLCEHLLSIALTPSPSPGVQGEGRDALAPNATRGVSGEGSRALDAQAMRAYQHLQETFPAAVRPEYSWLYCRAVERMWSSGGLEKAGANEAPSLDLFAVAFAHEADARAFFQERSWDFDAVEITYLILTASRAPGAFPANLGPEYPTRGTRLLLARSQALEETDQMEAALKTMDVLTRLAPRDARALDRQAFLHHKLGQDDAAMALLSRWQECHPDDPLPLARQAAFLYQKQQMQPAAEKLRQALERAHGKQRADIGCWGARLALRHGRTEAGDFQPEALRSALGFLEECVRHDPNHHLALSCMAAIRWQLGDLAALSAQAGCMNEPDGGDVRYAYFAALCHWAGHLRGEAEGRDTRGEMEAVIQRLSPIVEQDESKSLPQPSPNGNRRAEDELNLPLECAFLLGLARCRLKDWPAARAALEPVAQAATGPSTSQAQAILGDVCLAQEQYDDAAQWWQKLDAKLRAEWLLAEPLANTMFLASIIAYQSGRFEEAADKLRTAGKLGCRDRRIGPLLIQTLLRAGQAAYYGT